MRWSVFAVWRADRMESWHAICSVAHVAREQEIRGCLQQLPSKARRLASRDVTVALLACHRAIRSNPDVGVAMAFLEQREVRQNVNQYIPEKASTTTLLHAAVLRRDGGVLVVKVLLGLPEVDLNLVAFRSGLTPLHLACLLSRGEIVELLLSDRRVDVRAKSAVGNCTALHCACGALVDDEFDLFDWDRKRVDSTVSILLKGAATSGLRSWLRFLDERDRCGRTALHYASENDHKSSIEAILASLKEVSGLEIHQSTAHCAAKSILESKAQDIDDTLTPSSDHYAVVLAQDRKGLLPVHLAARMGHSEVVSLLLRCAPSTLRHCKDAGGLTPLHHAIRGGHLQILADWLDQYLSKSDFEQEIVERFLELLKVATHSQVALFLLKDLDQRLLKASTSPIRALATSLVHWAIIGSASSHGRLVLPYILKWQPGLANEVLNHASKLTPLHVSTLSGRLDLVETLCKEEGWSLGANKEDRSNKTALDYAHDLGHKEICEHLMQRADVKECLSNLQDDLNAHVAAANAILVVAVLIAGAMFANCIKPLTTSSPNTSLIVIPTTIFLTSITATVLGTCAASPFSFGFCGGKYANRSGYIVYRLRRIRVLLELASYFLLVSLANMVFGYLCSTFIAIRSTSRHVIYCVVFTAASACIIIPVSATCIGKALYNRSQHRSSMQWSLGIHP